MADLNNPLAPSTFQFEVDGLGAIDIKSVSIPDLAPKTSVAAVAGPKGVITNQINSSGFEGLFSFDVVCIASGTASSASAKLWKWFKACMPASFGGDGKLAGNKVNGAMTAYDSDNSEIARWTFETGFPSKYTCGEMDVAGDSPLEETYTITCEKFNQVK